MNRHIRSIVATMFAVALTAIAAEEPAVPTVVFYEIPGCPICKKINGWLDTLDKEHPKKAQIIRKPSSEALHAEMAARGIDHHGVVILTPAGEVSWRHNAHTLTEEALRQGFNQFIVGTPTSADKKLAVDVTGMDCGGCAKTITTALTKLDGITKCDITFENKGGVIQYDPAKLTEQRILETISKTGFKASVKK